MPESRFDKGLKLLRVSVHKLRQTLEPDGHAPYQYVLTRPGGYRFGKESCVIDVEVFSASLKRAQYLEASEQYESAVIQYEKAIAIYREYLPENRYEDWAVRQRDKYRRAYVTALVGAAECRARQGQYRRAVELCHKALAEDPYREDVYRQVMLYHHLMGNQNEALHLYEVYKETLTKQFAGSDVEPDGQTQQLHRQILAGNVPIDKDYPSPKSLHHPILHSLGRLPFVGRRQEWPLLLQHLEQAQQEKGRLVLISGDVGVGKSRLAQEVLQHAQSTLNANVLQGRCSELGAKWPYQPVFQAIQECVSQREPNLRNMSTLSLRVLSQWLPQFEALLDTPVSLAPLDEEQERLRLFAAMAELLFNQAQSRPPLLLFLDDLQWVDPSTVDFLDYLITQVDKHPVLILGTFRSEEVGLEHPLASLTSQTTRAMEEDAVHEVRLTPFSSADVNELLQHIAPALGGREQLGLHLHRESGGNPLFLVAILQTLFEQHIVTISPEGQWVVDVDAVVRGDRQFLPGEMQNVIKARIDQLDKQDRLLLELLSVIGHPCRGGMLAFIWNEFGVLATSELFEHLVRVQMITEEGAVYRFTHDKIQEVLYQNISSVRRRRLHRQLLEILEASDMSAQWPHAFFAHHCLSADLAQKALVYLLLALEDAVTGYRNEEALKLATEAWDVTEKLISTRETAVELQQTQFEILVKMVKAYSILGRENERKKALKLLLKLAHNLNDQHKTFQSRLLQTQHHLDMAHYDEALAEALAALEIAKELNDLDAHSQALHHLALVCWNTAAYPKALDYLRQEQELQQTLDDKQGWLETLRYLGLVSWWHGQYEQAAEYYQQALELERKLNDPQRRAQLLFGQGNLFWSKNEYEQAVRMFDEVRQLSHTIGDRRGEVKALSNLGLSKWSLGEYEAAKDLIQEAIEVYREIGDKRAQGLDLNNLGLVYWSLGADEQAHQSFEQAQQLFEKIG